MSLKRLQNVDGISVNLSYNPGMLILLYVENHPSVELKILTFVVYHMLSLKNLSWGLIFLPLCLTKSPSMLMV